MLNTGPWNRLPLTIQWLRQEYFQHFPIDRTPPTHIPIAYGTIKFMMKPVVHRSKLIEENETKQKNDIGTCLLCGITEEKVCFR